MTLAYSTHWPTTMPPHMAGKPTFFPEKILASLIWNYPDYDWEQYADEIDKIYQPYECTVGDFEMKHHTIRRDEKDRWKPGNNIHFVINNRTKNRFQFAPVVKCESVQKIEIYNLGETADVPMSYSIEKDDNGRFYDHAYAVWVDDELLGSYGVERLAINDGFDSVEDFFAWFNEDFQGKIIHWTGLKY